MAQYQDIFLGELWVDTVDQNTPSLPLKADQPWEVYNPPKQQVLPKV